MVSVEKAVIARIHRNGKVFEILVDSEKALAFKRGSPISMENILAVPQIFKDSKKGDRASTSDMESCFNTTDVFKIAEEIIRHGEIQLTTEQKRELTEEKRKEIANIISRQGVDPKTRLPHPPQRILNAMEQAHVVVDPFKPANTQIKDIIEKIQEILPISFEKVEIAARVPVQFAGKASFVIRKMANVKKEEWQSNYWIVLMEIPAGMQSEIYNKLNELTSGQVEVKIIKKSDSL